MYFRKVIARKIFKQDEKTLVFMLKPLRRPNESVNTTCSLPRGTYPESMVEMLRHFC